MNKKLVNQTQTVLKGNIERFNWEGEFSYDTETVDKDTYQMTLDYANSHVLLATFYDGEHTLTIQNPDLPTLFKRCNKDTTTIIMHNAPFDTSQITRMGGCVDYYTWFDTAVASHILDERRAKTGDTSLKKLAVKVLGVPKEEVLNTSNAWSNGWEAFVDYAENDAVWTYKLKQIFEPRLKGKLHRLFWKVSMPFQRVLRHMRVVGVDIDLDKIREQHEQITTKLHNTESALCHALGLKIRTEHNLLTGEVSRRHVPINLNSGKQKRELIYEDLGFPVIEETDGGKPSTSKETLKKLKGRAETEKQKKILDLILTYNKGSHLRSNFLESVPEQVEKDGKLRTNFKDTGTTSGRLSSSKPNLQNLPSGDVLGVQVRDSIIAPEGKKFVAVDYSGQENRVMAHVCDSKRLANIIKNDIDIHLVNAKKIYGLPHREEQYDKKHEDYKEIKKKYKDERHVGKSLSYGVPYGATPHTYMKRLGVTEEEAQRWIDAYWDNFPAVKEHKDKMEEELNQKGYVESIYGRRRHIDKSKGRYGEYYPPSKLRSAFNFYIQSPSGDMMRVALIKLFNYMNKNPEMNIEIHLTVHDEAVFSVKEEYAEKALRDAEELFADVVGKGFIVPMPAEGDIGNTYGEAK